jgi:phospholipid-translocating ATPase
MAVLGMSTYEENDEAPTSTNNSTKRLRWATQYKKGKSGNRKRLSILDRLHHRGSMNSEKKRNSGGSMGTDLGEIAEEPEVEMEEEHEEDRDNQGPRTIFFNIPLPADAVDEDGHPTKHYRRNKIRTAKYTPLSFIPKNLWFQFHNIANVYFLFLIILAVSFLAPIIDTTADMAIRSSVFLARQIPD